MVMLDTRLLSLWQASVESFVHKMVILDARLYLCDNNVCCLCCWPNLVLLKEQLFKFVGGP